MKKDERYSFKSYNRQWIAAKRAKEREIKTKKLVSEIRQIVISLWHLYKK